MFDVWQALPDRSGRSAVDALKHPPENRFHLFTDGRIRPIPSDNPDEEYKYGSRWGHMGLGCTVVDVEGNERHSAGKAADKSSNQVAEMRAIHFGLKQAAEYFDRTPHIEGPEDIILCAHTDGRTPYRAIKYGKLRDNRLTQIAGWIDSATEDFAEVYFFRCPTTNPGIQHAERQAFKALRREVDPNITWRGSKGRHHGRPVKWNPFDGEDGWMTD